MAKTNQFANIVSYRKRKKDDTVEEDVQGRTIWALGYVIFQNYLSKKLRENALKLFQSSIFLLNKKIKAPRAMAFTIVGLYFYLKIFPKNKKLIIIFKNFADQLLELYKNNSSSDWHWFEGYLTYSNSRLPEALFYAYDLLKDKNYLKILGVT